MRQRQCAEDDCEEYFKPEYAGQICCRACTSKESTANDVDEASDTEDDDSERSSLDVDVVFEQPLMSEELRALSFAEPLADEEQEHPYG